MFVVKCPKCGKNREVQARKPWMVGPLPYLKLCMVCSQTGKPKSEATKKKLSEAVKKTQTAEVKKKKSEFMLAHPELWVNPQSSLGHEAWTGQQHTEETKKQIGESVKKAWERRKGNE